MCDLYCFFLFNTKPCYILEKNDDDTNDDGHTAQHPNCLLKRINK